MKTRACAFGVLVLCIHLCIADALAVSGPDGAGSSPPAEVAKSPAPRPDTGTSGSLLLALVGAVLVGVAGIVVAVRSPLALQDPLFPTWFPEPEGRPAPASGHLS